MMAFIKTASNDADFLTKGNLYVGLAVMFASFIPLQYLQIVCYSASCKTIMSGIVDILIPFTRLECGVSTH